MNYIILFLALATPALASAHCPIALDIQGEAYCTDIRWLNADQKVKGLLEETGEISPYLIASGQVPQKWVYTKAEFHIWKEGDSSHTPQAPEGLRIFPYMFMDNGHHHSASYDFSYDPGSGTYVLRALALHAMKGCWTLRWTTDSQDTMETSAPLASILEYSNLDDADNAAMAGYCATLGGGGTDSSDNGHHH